MLYEVITDLGAAIEAGNSDACLSGLSAWLSEKVGPAGKVSQDALLLIEASLTQHGILLRFVARHNPRVEGFRGEFAQVVLNLLSNAKDAILAAKPTRNNFV